MKPVRNQILYSLLAVLCGGLTWVAQADLTNNFTAGLDYFASGIIGETNWDGVYFGAGDIPGGTGTGTTSQANETTFPGFLYVQGTVGAWVGNEDDSFFIYKVVQGDFDAAVAIAPQFANSAYHLPGLLARAYNPNNSGAPYSTNGTVNENWMYIARFQEFGINEHGRYATNGADFNGWFDTAGDSNDTNSGRFVRLTRVGDVFSFYEKTNVTDAWVLCGSLPRPDLDGVAMQVGIKDESGTANTPITYFTNFVLIATNVTQPAMPTPPSGLITTATNISGSLTFSWTPGTVGDGELVVIKPTATIDHNPVNGITYNSDGGFGDPNTLLGGANAFVVFNGVGSSVTVSNLAGYNTVYTVAVYEYSGSGSSTVYNTASPATNNFPGPGQIIGVIETVTSTNIPVGGASAGILFATFSSGGGSIDESTSPQTVWTTSDPTIAQFVNGRTLVGIAPGTVQAIGTFNGVFSSTNTVTVHNPAYTDSFGQTLDYVANGLMGSTWDGLFLNFGDVPNANKGNDGAAGHTSHLDANITRTNALTVESAGSTWAVAGNDGPYLFKVVTGDFEAVVHSGVGSVINTFDSGIMARLYDNTGTATQGGGGGAGGTETHINWVKVQNGTPAVRRTIDSGGTTVVGGLSAADGWLLMQRVNSTNFYMYESPNPTNWTLVTSLVIPEAANNAPMEVGIEQEMRTASDGAGWLDSAMIDGPGITPPATPPPPANGITGTLNGDLSMTFNWDAADASGNPIRSALIMRAGAPVTAVPTLAQAGSIGGTGTPVTFASGLDLAGGNVLVFATGNPAASTNVSCTVQGLTPGVTYYASVVTFTGSGGSKSFNTVVPAGAITNLQDGSLIGVSTVPLAPIPLGGIGQLQVLGVFQGGITINVSQFATLSSSNPNIIATASGVLTGIALGSATITVVYSGFTNTATVTVRNPGFTDNYSVSQDYLVNGVAGTPYDGLYNPNPGGVQIPESQYVPLAGSGAVTADANVTSNGVFTITSAGDGWENDAAGGFFLFKYVPGDFQMAVHINSMDNALDGGAYNQPGILARAYSNGTNGTDQGSPFVLGTTTNLNGATETAGETWVDLSRFDEYGIGTYARLNIDGAVLESTQPGGLNPPGVTNIASGDDGMLWLLIARSQGTNFNLYMRATNNAPWQLLPLGTSYQLSDVAGVPMQVGIMAGPWTGGGGTTRTVQYDSFMLDAGPPPLQASKSGANVNLSWSEITAGSTLQQTLSLSPANWQPVAGTLTTNAGLISISVPMTNSATFFRLYTP